MARPYNPLAFIVIYLMALFGFMGTVSAGVSQPLALPLYNTQATAMDSDYFELQQATTQMEAKNYTEALNHLEKAIEKNPISLMASYNQGLCYLELARTSTQRGAMKSYLNASERAFLRAQSLNPDLLVTYFKLGKVALIQKNFDGAKHYYVSALEIDPENAVLHFNLAGVYDEQHDYDEAILHYKRAIEIDGHFIYAYNNLGLIYEASQKLDLAESVYRQALEKDQKYNYARLNLGNLYAEQGRFREAKRLYKRALIYEPENAWAHLYLGNIYFQNDDYAKAADAYQASIERNPDYATTYYLHAVSLNRLQRYDEALISSLKYLSVSPQGRYTQSILSLILSLKLHQADAKEK